MLLEAVFTESPCREDALFEEEPPDDPKVSGAGRLWKARTAATPAAVAASRMAPRLIAGSPGRKPSAGRRQKLKASRWILIFRNAEPSDRGDDAVCERRRAADVDVAPGHVGDEPPYEACVEADDLAWTEELVQPTGARMNEGVISSRKGRSSRLDARTITSVSTCCGSASRIARIGVMPTPAPTSSTLSPWRRDAVKAP